MKAILPVMGIVLLLVGGIWFLQGIGALPGSFMTGQAFWAWTGLTCLIAGFVALFVGLQRLSRRG